MVAHQQWSGGSRGGGVSKIVSYHNKGRGHIIRIPNKDLTGLPKGGGMTRDTQKWEIGVLGGGKGNFL